MAEDKKKCLGKEISMDVKDTFFDDPFFRDWWNDFDVPMKDKTLQRQISGNILLQTNKNLRVFQILKDKIYGLYQ